MFVRRLFDWLFGSACLSLIRTHVRPSRDVETTLRHQNQIARRRVHDISKIAQFSARAAVRSVRGSVFLQEDAVWLMFDQQPLKLITPALNAADTPSHKLQTFSRIRELRASLTMGEVHSHASRVDLFFPGALHLITSSAHSFCNVALACLLVSFFKARLTFAERLAASTPTALVCTRHRPFHFVVVFPISLAAVLTTLRARRLYEFLRRPGCVRVSRFPLASRL